MDDVPRGPEPQPRRTTFDSALSVRLVAAAAAAEECARLILGDSHFIGLTELRILAYLFERPRVSVSEISRDLQIDKAWISRLLKQLERRHLVDRTRHRSDPRQLVIALTASGQDFHTRVMARVEPYGERIAAGIDEGLAIAMLGRLEQNLRVLNTDLRASDTT
jgi:DNA-binding MarR family transcriptional regulator